MDPLSEVLRSVRLTGGVFLSADFTAPWSVSVRINSDDCAPFLARPAQMIGYHVIVEGRLLVALEGEPLVDVGAGEIVLFPRNDAHTLASEPDIKPMPARQLIQPSPDGGLARICYGGGGTATRIVCGFLASEETTNPLISTLPKALKIDVRQGATREWIEASVRFAAGELAEGKLASSSVMTRVSESLLIEAVRQYSSTLHEEELGWLKGLKDPHIGHALACPSVNPSASQRTLVRGSTRKRSCAFAQRFRGKVHVPCRRAAYSIPHCLAASDRKAELARDPQDDCPVGVFRRVRF